MNLLQNIKDWKLRTKFILPISGMLIACIIVISTFLTQQQAEGFRHELETNGETMIRILAMQAESGVLFEAEYDLDELLERFSVFEDVQAAIIYNNEKRILSRLGEWELQEIKIIREIAPDESHNHPGYYDFYIEDQSGQEFI
ncbi:MAG: hypothetical protein U9R56_04660, partial [candidate division Zixibacteria bacterium]|nr:hypothetical protein [candidate division Zixibacteria bacterium]